MFPRVKLRYLLVILTFFLKLDLKLTIKYKVLLATKHSAMLMANKVIKWKVFSPKGVMCILTPLRLQSDFGKS